VKRIITYDTFLSDFRTIFPEYSIVEIETDNLIFEERVKLNCFYCNKYKTNWKCPPNIPVINYQKTVKEYDNACFVYKRHSLNADTFNTVRYESTNDLHKTLLEMEKILFSVSNGLVVSFIGGSCKLCKSGCGSGRCNNPYQARIPLEAIGINVIESANKYNIKIEFPIKDSLLRLGLILW
jgi:predicted metal-binding protein